MEEVKLLSSEGELKFNLSGEIDVTNAEEFYTQVEKAFKNRVNNLIFDCEKLEFIDSTALGMFVKISKMAEASDKKITLCNLKSNIKKLFVICSLDKFIGIKG